MSTRRVDRVVSDAETAELIARLARDKTFSQGVADSSPDFFLDGTRATISLTNLGQIRVETTPALPPVSYFSDAQRSLWDSYTESPWPKE